MTWLADLRARGFVQGDGVLTKGDFETQDDSDGRGVYIRYWHSAEKCPYPEHIREPVLPVKDDGIEAGE